MTLNDLWKRVIILMFGQICPMCGHEAVDVHHLYPKGMGGACLNTCFNPLNGVPLCRACHDHIHCDIGEAVGREWLATKLPHVMDRLHEEHKIQSTNKKELRKELIQMLNELS